MVNIYLNIFVFLSSVNLRSLSKDSFSGVKSLTQYHKGASFSKHEFPIHMCVKKRRTLLVFNGYF